MGDVPSNGRWNLIDAVRHFAPEADVKAYDEVVSAWPAAPCSPKPARNWIESHGSEYEYDRRADHARDKLKVQADIHWQTAWQAVRDQLISGTLRAEGCPGSANAAPARIRETSWKYVGAVDWERSVITVAGTPPVRFYDVQIYESPETAAEKKTKDTIAAETGCLEWLQKQVAASPNRRPQTKTAYWAEAKQSHPRLSKKAFKRAWEQATLGNTAWNRPGPTRAEK